MIDQKAPQTNLFAQLMQCILHAIENPPHALASIGMPRLQMGVMLLQNQCLAMFFGAIGSHIGIITCRRNHICVKEIAMIAVWRKD